MIPSINILQKVTSIFRVFKEKGMFLIKLNGSVSHNQKLNESKKDPAKVTLNVHTILSVHTILAINMQD